MGARQAGIHDERQGYTTGGRRQSCTRRFNEQGCIQNGSSRACGSRRGRYRPGGGDRRRTTGPASQRQPSDTGVRRRPARRSAAGPQRHGTCVVHSRTRRIHHRRDRRQRARSDLQRHVVRAMPLGAGHRRQQHDNRDALRSCRQWRVRSADRTGRIAAAEIRDRSRRARKSYRRKQMSWRNGCRRRSSAPA